MTRPHHDSWLICDECEDRIEELEEAGMTRDQALKRAQEEHYEAQAE